MSLRLGMTEDRAPILADLAEMKQKLAEFRRTEPTRSPLPDTLWQPIVQLNRIQGPYCFRPSPCRTTVCSTLCPSHVPRRKYTMKSDDRQRTGRIQNQSVSSM